jgi:hypothetical protein
MIRLVLGLALLTALYAIGSFGMIDLEIWLGCPPWVDDWAGLVGGLLQVVMFLWWAVDRGVFRDREARRS